MDAQQFLLDMFTFMQSIFGLLAGVIALELAAFLLLARHITESRNPDDVGRAIFGYMMLTVGMLLMSLSAIPTLISVFGSAGFTVEIYFGLVLIFAIGGLLYLWHDYRVRELPADAVRLPKLIYHFFVKTIGQLSLVLAVLYFTMSLALQGTDTEGWWSMPLTILLYGLLLTFLTMEPAVAAKKSVVATSRPLVRGKKK
jgi:hypothetical protein